MPSECCLRLCQDNLSANSSEGESLHWSSKEVCKRKRDAQLIRRGRFLRNMKHLLPVLACSSFMIHACLPCFDRVPCLLTSSCRVVLHPFSSIDPDLCTMYWETNVVRPGSFVWEGLFFLTRNFSCLPSLCTAKVSRKYTAKSTQYACPRLTFAVMGPWAFGIPPTIRRGGRVDEPPQARQIGVRAKQTRPSFACVAFVSGHAHACLHLLGDRWSCRACVACMHHPKARAWSPHTRNKASTLALIFVLVPARGECIPNTNTQPADTLLALFLHYWLIRRRPRWPPSSTND